MQHQTIWVIGAWSQWEVSCNENRHRHIVSKLWPFFGYWNLVSCEAIWWVGGWFSLQPWALSAWSVAQSWSSWQWHPNIEYAVLVGCEWRCHSSLEFSTMHLHVFHGVQTCFGLCWKVDPPVSVRLLFSPNSQSCQPLLEHPGRALNKSSGFEAHSKSSQPDESSYRPQTRWNDSTSNSLWCLRQWTLKSVLPGWSKVEVRLYSLAEYPWVSQIPCGSFCMQRKSWYNCKLFEGMKSNLCPHQALPCPGTIWHDWLRRRPLKGPDLEVLHHPVHLASLQGNVDELNTCGSQQWLEPLGSGKQSDEEHHHNHALERRHIGEVPVKSATVAHANDWIDSPSAPYHTVPTAQ